MCCAVNGGTLAHSLVASLFSRLLPVPQRTLAVELQRLSIQFRKQQKAYLNRLRSKDGGGSGAAGSSYDLLGVEGAAGRQQQEDYDPGFSDMQVCVCVWSRVGGVCQGGVWWCIGAG